MNALTSFFMDNYKRGKAGLTDPLRPFDTMPKLHDLRFSDNQLTGTDPAGFLGGVGNNYIQVNVFLDKTKSLAHCPLSSVGLLVNWILISLTNLSSALAKGSVISRDGWTALLAYTNVTPFWWYPLPTRNCFSLRLCFSEWGVWHHPFNMKTNGTDMTAHPWQRSL